MMRAAWFFEVGLGLSLTLATSAAAQNPPCPLDTSGGFVLQDRMFTDSAGNTANYQLALPTGYDPSVPGPVAVYFHGNNPDDGGSFEPNVSPLLFDAQIEDMPVVALESLGSRTNMDGSVVKTWSAEDPQLLRELLASDFDGCIALDPKQLYLVSGSEGTCYLAVLLTQWIGYEYEGGFLGLCGCWQWGDRNWEVRLDPLRDHWKLFIENTTEDFLHERGLIGLDDFGHNMGLDVRTDLMRPGAHCENAYQNVPAVMSWMRGQSDYPREYPDQPHYQQVDFIPNSAQAIAYDAMRDRFLVAVNRPDLTQEQRDAIHEHRITTGYFEPDGYEMWLADNYPETSTPALFVMATGDYGESFSVLTKRTELVTELLVRSSGSVLMATEGGLLQSTDGGTTFTMLAFEGMDVQALVEDEEGRLFATVGGLAPLQRSTDDGASWQPLTLNTGLLPANSENELRVQGGRLMAYGGSGVLRFSEDGGETFSEVTIPGDNPLDAAHWGDFIYAVTDNGTRVVASPDRGQSWNDLTGFGTNGHTVGVAPDGALWVNEFENLQWRSRDNGASFEREPGLHNVRAMDIAYGQGEQRMVVAGRGIFRHSDAVVPEGMPGTDGGVGGAGAAGTVATGGTSAVDPSAGAGGAAGGVAAGSAGAGGMPLAGSPAGQSTSMQDSGGCGCRALGVRSDTGGAFSALGALVALVVRRRSRRRR